MLVEGPGDEHAHRQFSKRERCVRGKGAAVCLKVHTGEGKPSLLRLLKVHIHAYRSSDKLSLEKHVN